MPAEGPQPTGQQSAAPQEQRARPSFPIVGLGSSAGGLEALEAFFDAVPSDCGMGFVVISHLDPRRESELPKLLRRRTALPVQRIEDGEVVHPNVVYVLPNNREATIEAGVLHLQELTQTPQARLPIDVFLRALAQDQGPNAAAVILSGTGTDGTQGLRAIKAEGGLALAQDEESAAFDGMPRSAIATGLVDVVARPEAMAEQLLGYFERVGGRPTAAPRQVPPDVLKRILHVLRARTDHDFSLYKQSTISRRIERRMHLQGIVSFADYARYLEDSEREAQVLFKELLIGVTSFFRDPEAFEALRGQLSQLVERLPQDATLRAWIPACSTGEEAYSVAILLHEVLEGARSQVAAQIFATDIDEQAIEVARAGAYPASIAADIPAELLKRFFVARDEQYHARKSIRRLLVFATQNVAKDPPFTRLDLLCCRNLLIYLEPPLQAKLLGLFHFSLKPGGLLLLGSSESVGQAQNLFSVIDKRWKLFRRRPTSAPVPLDFPLPRTASVEAVEPRPAARRRSAERAPNPLELIETILQQSGTPPCIIVDEDLNLVYLYGRTGRFLEPPEGLATLNIVELARPGLRLELSGALRRAAREHREVVLRAVGIELEEGETRVDLTVRPIPEEPGGRALILVLFQETEAPSGPGTEGPRQSERSRSGRTARELEQALRYTRESLQTTIEELETSNEELKSTNEELQSANEELQSTNEELETSKEELQSLNEEASTVNAELQRRVAELTGTNDDMKNLLDSTDVATVFLDTELRIRRFTPRVTEIVNLTPTDVGRPVAHFASTLVGIDLAEHAQAVLADLGARQLNARSRSGGTYCIRLRPYRTTQNVIEGVVLTFEDVTQVERRVEQRIAESLLENDSLKRQLQDRWRAESALREREEEYRLLVERLPAAVFRTDAEGRLVFVNRRAVELLGRPQSELLGDPWVDLLLPAERAAAAAQSAALLSGGASRAEMVCGLAREGQAVGAPVRLTLVLLKDDEGRSTGLLGHGLAEPADASG